MHTTERKYKEAIQDYQTVARMDPRSTVAYNSIGYLDAYLHDLNGAQKSIEQYAKLAQPNDPNPLDSLGEVHFLLGDFAAAERYFLQSFSKNASVGNMRELLKAAVAHLMTGDVPGSDAIFQKYFDLLKSSDPQALDIPRAQWEFFSGRRRAAMGRLEGLLKSHNADTSALAGTQLSFWKSITGDRSAAAALSRNAMLRATNPGVRNLAVICAWLAKPSAAPAPANALVQGMGKALLHQYVATIPLLEKIYRETPPANDGDVRALLAWTYLEDKQDAAARPLVDLYPLIFPAPDALFAGLTFPKFLAARAQLVAREHNDSEVQRARQLANRFAGDVRDRF